MNRRTFIGSVGQWSPGGTIAEVLLEGALAAARTPPRYPTRA
jgi:hypothetical protein